MRIDAHCDTAMYLLRHKTLDTLPQADLDFDRLQQYLDVAFFAICTETPEYQSRETEIWDAVFTALLRDVEEEGPWLEVLTGRRQLQESRHTMILIGAEGAKCLGASAEHLQRWFDQGLRFLGLTWNLNNPFAGGCAENGEITPAGKALIRRCNQMGILLDAAHMGEKSFWQLTEYCDAPFIVSHTCCAALNPDPGPYPRNITDRQMREMARLGCVAGITFVPDFLGAPGNLERLCDHIAHAADIMGIEGVALGSDYDGADLGDGMQGVEYLPLLYQALSDRGFSEREICRVAGDNIKDLLQQVLPQ
ncbi:MAG: dipeptidase [Firmicutes bacterium]|nr:dipeptidase [Bacillota bacterium]